MHIFMLINNVLRNYVFIINGFRCIIVRREFVHICLGIKYIFERICVINYNLIVISLSNLVKLG